MTPDAWRAWAAWWSACAYSWRCTFGPGETAREMLIAADYCRGMAERMERENE